MCIGAPLAMLELRAALCVLLKRFNFQLHENACIDAQVVSTMLGPASPVDATVIPAAELPSAVALNGNIHELVRLKRPDQPIPLPKAA